MISQEKIRDIISETIENDGYFIVEVDIKPNNRIIVSIDGDKGVPISYCVSISRLIEQTLDRETEDFELEVSSAGIGSPFKVDRQYQKATGKEVEVITHDHSKTVGILSATNKNGFIVTEERKVKIEGKKKKELQIIEHTFTFDQVKSVKEVIKFK